MGLIAKLEVCQTGRDLLLKWSTSQTPKVTLSTSSHNLRVATTTLHLLLISWRQEFLGCFTSRLFKKYLYSSYAQAWVAYRVDLSQIDPSSSSSSRRRRRRSEECSGMPRPHCGKKDPSARCPPTAMRTSPTSVTILNLRLRRALGLSNLSDPINIRMWPWIPGISTRSCSARENDWGHTTHCQPSENQPPPGRSLAQRRTLYLAAWQVIAGPLKEQEGLTKTPVPAQPPPGRLPLLRQTLYLAGRLHLTVWTLWAVSLKPTSSLGPRASMTKQLPMHHLIPRCCWNRASSWYSSRSWRKVIKSVT